MTIKYARKILGKLAENISDKELLKEIEVAEAFKEFFFNQLTKSSGRRMGEW